jgi:uncharacterized MAPEG superfamily protein
MSIPPIFLYCLIAAAAMPYVPYLAVTIGRFQAGYDFNAPRALFDKLPDFAKRATWAHQNSFEVFPLFATAVTMVCLTGKTTSAAETSAIAFIVLRLLYSAFYIANIPIARSGCWALGMGCIGSLMLTSLGG